VTFDLILRRHASPDASTSMSTSISTSISMPAWMHLDEVSRHAIAVGYGGRVAVGHVTKLSALPRAKLLETAQHGDGRRRRHRAAGHRPDGLRAGGECSARRRAGRSAASTVWCVRLHLYQVRWKWHRALRLWSAPCSDIPPLGKGRYLWGNSALCGLDWRLSHRLCLC
jgi:hypothetical protein